MPAEVFGYLRDDATFGEKMTLDLLKRNLPSDFRVFVETPIHGDREDRFPDFIITTNYGVIVIEVKDWIQLVRLDPSGCTVRTREQVERKESNPVTIARDMGIALEEHFKKKQLKKQLNGAIGWGHMAILPRLGLGAISQAKAVWGEDRVVSESEMRNPNILRSRLRNTIRADRIQNLTREQQDILRSVIYPITSIEKPDRDPIILDDVQTKIVAEKPAVEEKVETKTVEQQKEKQIDMFGSSVVPAAPDNTEAIESTLAALSERVAIRLIRGVAGSGKTLVLEQRAKFLSAQYPDWKILVLTYNDNLARSFQSVFNEQKNIEVRKYHTKCIDLLQLGSRHYDSSDNFIVRILPEFPSLSIFSPDFLSDEIDWIKDNGINDREAYLAAKRKGRGITVRVSTDQRQTIFDLFERCAEDLRARKMIDWGDLPIMTMNGFKDGTIQNPSYDAILIDEAQDFAPVWIKTVTGMLKPDKGVLFLADDPTQSIYKSYTWKEKGVPVVGHTRWLTVPYRNTFEIIQLANEMILRDEDLRIALTNEGLTLPTAKDMENIRHDERPLFIKVNGVDQEAEYIDNTISDLADKGISVSDMALLYLHKRDLDRVQRHLKTNKLRKESIHSFKGLEAEVIFIIGAEGAFDFDDTDAILKQKRVFYMAFTRSRRKLFVTYIRALPKQLSELSDHFDQIAL